MLVWFGWRSVARGGRPWRGPGGGGATFAEMAAKVADECLWGSSARQGRGAGREHDAKEGWQTRFRGL